MASYSFSSDLTFRWQLESSWTTDDKFAHASCGYALSHLLRLTGMSYTNAVMTSIFAGIGWEAKDGYLRWEDHGWWGGDGFDPKDFAAVVVGAVGFTIAEHGIKKIFSNDKKTEIANYENKISSVQLASNDNFENKFGDLW